MMAAAGGRLSSSSPLLWLICYLATASCGIIIQTRLGWLEGKEHRTERTGSLYYSFRGLPYAKPPVGKLRLRNPVPYGSWPGILDATKAPPVCTQGIFLTPYLRNKVIGEEDCLYLNIYKPQTNYYKKLPVLVYIHGGGFRSGNPGPEEAPSNFMEEEVILVTVQYRLGALGFLSTEDYLISGNFGLKDQAMAIRWINVNIDQFGGDPSSITVFGESAGGASAHYLITSPLSRGMIKGGIAQSGVIDATWALASPGKGRQVAEQLAEIVGCDFDAYFLDCLQGLNATKIISAEKEFIVWDIDPGCVFQPVIEVENEGAFMTEDPRKVRVNTTLMTGIVQGEGILKIASLINQDDTVLNDFIENIDQYLPAILFIDSYKPNIGEFIERVKDRYFKDLTNRDVVLACLEKMYKEAFSLYPMVQTLQRHEGSKFVYVFDHRAENSISDTVGPKKVNSKKPCHGDEILSLFNWTSVFPYTKGRKEDIDVSIKLVKLWTNFASYQNPTSYSSLKFWQHYDNGNIYHIETDKETMRHFNWDEIINFWSSAYRLINY